MTTIPLSRRRFLASTTTLAAFTVYGRTLAQVSDPTDLTIQEAARLIRSGKLSPVELVQAYLTRIKAIDPDVNSYITVTGQLALEQAKTLEKELSMGLWRGPLHGIPVALKDNYDTAGILTSGGSAVFADRVPEENAETVRLLTGAGAILLGKLNLHEFAFGGTSAVTHYGPVHNPWNIDYIPGGSSGGSAAAVAAHLCAAAMGTDTAASIRMPAAYCGITGLKPTYGLVSIRGIIPLSESLDHAGPMCRTVTDCALMLQTLAGYDPADVTSIHTRIPRYINALYQPVSGLKLGIPGSPFYDDLHPDIAAAMDDALTLLSKMTGGTRETTLPPTPPIIPLLSEAYSYHAKYVENKNTRKLYQAPTLQRILGGSKVSRMEYIETRRNLELIRKTIDKVFAEVDLIITPTTPVLPQRIDQLTENIATAPMIEARNTLPFNFYGIPSITVPCGFSRNGLPIGLQISGPRLRESRVLALAHAYEQATGWHTRRPPTI